MREEALIGYLGILLFFGMIIFEGRSLLLLAGLAGLLLSVLATYKNGAFKSVSNATMTSYGPFVIFALVLAFFQEKPSDVLWGLSIPMGYFLARLLRASFSISTLFVGVGLAGIGLGAVNLLAGSGMADLVPTIEKLAEYHHKNAVGWTLAFGTVGFSLLAMMGLKSKLAAVGSAASAVASAILMIFVGSVTSIIAAVAALSAYSVLNVTRLMLGRPGNANRAGPYITAGGAAVLGSVLMIVNTMGTTDSYLSALLARGSNLTGRTEIWRCYLEGRRQDVTKIGQFVYDCTGFASGSLHNSFLEADKNGGIFLAVLLLVGFALSVVFAIRKVMSAVSSEEITDANLSLTFAVIGFMIAITESYVFSGFVYISLLVFLAPRLSSQGPKSVIKKLSASLKRGVTVRANGRGLVREGIK